MAIYNEVDDPSVVEGVRETSPGGTGGTGENTDDGLVVTGFDENGNPISPPQRVSAAEAKRRTDLWASRQTFGPNTKRPTEGFDQELGPTPADRPDYGDATMFDAPDFEWNGKVPDFHWGEQWQAPNAEAALNDPGYQFRANEGLRGLQQSAAARGLLGSGGTLKDIAGWSQNFAKQEYGDVFNRNLAGYNTRFGTAKDVYDRDLGAYQAKFGTAKDVFDRRYTGAKDEYAPKLFEWQTNAHGADLGFNQAWQNYWKNNLSAEQYANLSPL